MLTEKKQKGFTLVELAIVLVIVGLLIGGILKGQQLMENASITATVSQIRAIEAATTNFRDSYGGLPGDLLDASYRIANCTDALCSNDASETSGSERFRAGDGIVGNTDWDMMVYQPGATLSTSTAIVKGSAAGRTGAQYGMETLLFWHSLQQAGLINAVTDPMTNGGGDRQQFGRTIPRAEIAGGFWAGYTSSPTTALAPWDTAGSGTYSLLGTILSLVGDPGQDIETTTNDMNAVRPVVAATIDRKIDDGIPNSGYVQGLGHAECVSDAGALYNESSEKLDCGIHIIIVPQG